MGDIHDPRVLWAKFALFIALGLLAVGLALALFPSVQLALLIAVTVWAFCRAYYFAFYVIEHYVDSKYRYSGLASFVRYALQRRRRG